MSAKVTFSFDTAKEASHFITILMQAAAECKQDFFGRYEFLTKTLDSMKVVNSGPFLKTVYEKPRTCPYCDCKSLNFSEYDSRGNAPKCPEKVEKELWEEAIALASVISMRLDSYNRSRGLHYCLLCGGIQVELSHKHRITRNNMADVYGWASNPESFLLIEWRCDRERLSFDDWGGPVDETPYAFVVNGWFRMERKGPGSIFLGEREAIYLGPAPDNENYNKVFETFRQQKILIELFVNTNC